MSNTTLNLHALITSITINGVVKTPDGAGNIVVASADVAALFRGNTCGMPNNDGPISFFSGPTDPTT